MFCVSAASQTYASFAFKIIVCITVCSLSSTGIVSKSSHRQQASSNLHALTSKVKEVAGIVVFSFQKIAWLEIDMILT